MTPRTLLLAVIFFPLFPFAQDFGGNPASVKWKQVNTPKVRIIFPTGLDSQANRMANIITTLGGATAGTVGERERKWNIILQNQTTISNAYVRMAPVMSELYMVPGQDNFSTGSLRWDDNLVIHEHRHIQQFSNFNKGIAKVASVFLGQEGQLVANGIFIPNYYFEGDATWQETLVSRQGRGRMPAFYNGFKALWLENKNYKWQKIRSGSYKDFVPDHYPMGYMMIAYGYEKHGQDFWKKITGDALHLRGFNRGIKRYSGKHFLDFYASAMDFFKQQSLPVNRKTTALQFITPVQKNNVIDYRYPAFISNDSILVSKQSYKQPSAFYILTNGREEKLKVKDLNLDEYFSYRNGNIVYAAFHSDPRWGNRDFSVIKMLNIYTGAQKQIGSRSKYFSPDINEAGTEIIAVNIHTNGKNNLVQLDAGSGKVIHAVANPNNYFFTQTKYLDAHTAVSAVREPGGKMALVKVTLANGQTEELTPFSFNVMGYPFVKGDTIFFSYMHQHADKVFAVLLSSKQVFRVTDNDNGVYNPVVNGQGEMLVSAFTTGGYRLARTTRANTVWEPVSAVEYSNTPDLYTPAALQKNAGAGVLYQVTETKNPVVKYRKTSRLFNFHSWRPVVDDPEYGYSFYSDNVLSSFSNSLYYTFNRSDRSHTVGFAASYAGWYPVLNVLAEHSFNRSLDTAVGKPVQFNAAKLEASVTLPLRFVGGRSNKFVNLGAGYNIEPVYYTGIGKNAFTNRALNYVNSFLTFTNQSRQAKQNIFPHWAQAISLSYRDAFTFVNSHKLVGNSSFYFPGLFANHSLVINGAYQKRDSFPDIFSKTFSYSRGYEALSTRRMYKFGVNYHFPVAYPDWGFANALFFQRIRANTFYDHTNAKARVNGVLTEILNRSAGAELYIDFKVLNALPLSIGVRFAHLLDTDLTYPGTRNRWELIIPIGIIPE